MRDREVRLPGHVIVETYSVLTRMPPPFRVPGPVVADYILRRFPGAPLTLSPDGYRALLLSMARAGISGGASYDALVAATVSEAGRILLSRDRRAAAIYERLDVQYEVVD